MHTPWAAQIKVHDSSSTSRVSPDATDGTLTLSGGPLTTTSASDKVGLALFRLQFASRRLEITILGFSRFRRPY
jgi:hypothetical protein